MSLNPFLEERRILHAACMEHVKHARVQFNFRRDIEWKFQVALWALLVGIIIKVEEVHKAVSDPQVFGVGLLAFGIIYIIWLLKTALADENDRRMMHHFRREAELVLILGPHYEIGRCPHRLSYCSKDFLICVETFLQDWMHLFYLAITGILWMADWQVLVGTRTIIDVVHDLVGLLV